MNESIIVLGSKWRKQGIGDEEIKQRFLQIGFKPEWVDYYFKAKPMNENLPVINQQPEITNKPTILI